MKYKDEIYGQYNIEEPVLVELINSESLQRLKRIAQWPPKQFYHLDSFTRFEHSLGTMILLRILGADLKEQVAGLIHDVSHTAFSHVFDWVMDDLVNEDYQSIHQHKNFLAHSGISNILKKYNFDSDEIAKIKNFTLLEREIPHLCADRVDYALREFKIWTNPTIVDSLIENLENYQNRIIFKNLKSAQVFADSYLKCQREHWGGYENAGRYYLLSSVVKEALDKKILALDDFYQDDNFIINKLVQSKDNQILEPLNLLRNKKLPKNYNWNKKVIIKKFRYVDPEVNDNGKIKRLSQLLPQFKSSFEKQKKISQKGVVIYVNF